MHIGSIIVENFRQLKNITLSFERDMTVLAGPNNSGKTTVINLLKKLLKSDSFNFNEDDIPVMEADKWFSNTFDILKEYLKAETKPEEEVKKILEKMFSVEDKVIIPECKVKFKIDYSVGDDLRNFMDYLMDLDDSKHSFYFVFSLELNINTFEKLIIENYSKLMSRFNSSEINKDSIKDILIKLYARSIQEKCCFTDEEYENGTVMETSKFRKLFNLEIINAGRPLDDYGDENGHSLSKKLISLASKDEKWKDLIKELPDKVLLPIQESQVGDAVKKTSTKVLNKTINALSKTNGNYAGTIELNMDINEDDIDSLLNRITCAKYNIDKYSFQESSQGLGYSNLIYMHIDLQKFLKNIDLNVVNLFFIEEPEAHMHPQMQSVFIKYLLDYYSKSNIQGLITTHSNEIARCCSIEKLRVIRRTSEFKSEIFNLSIFINQLTEEIPVVNKESIGEDEKAKDEVVAGKDKLLTKGNELESESIDENSTKEILKNFYDWFFEIGYSEIVFADSVILYEGDTERLYIKRIITREKFKSLQRKYIAFIQVGGAYAYNFKALINYLKIKTLMITDIDYKSNPINIDDILESSSTNSTITKFYCEEKFNSIKPPKGTEIKIKDLYEWIRSKNNIVSTCKTDNNKEKELIYLAFQTEKDNYSRTLEAAMLAKKFNINAYDSVKRSEWINKRKETMLKFSVPNNRFRNTETKEREEDSTFTLRDILEATSNGKTDFMYSVIMHGFDESMLPTYIQEGLEWLMK